jgi:hypothetical protein
MILGVVGEAGIEPTTLGLEGLSWRLLPVTLVWNTLLFSTIYIVHLS